MHAHGSHVDGVSYHNRIAGCTPLHCLIKGVSDVLLHSVVLRHSEARDRIPTLGGLEAFACARTSVLSTLIVPNGDVDEGCWMLRMHLVEQLVHWSKGFASLLQGDINEPRGNTSPCWRRCRCTPDRLPPTLRLNVHKEIVSHGCHVRVATTR